MVLMDLSANWHITFWNEGPIRLFEVYRLRHDIRKRFPPPGNVEVVIASLDFIYFSEDHRATTSA